MEQHHLIARPRPDKEQLHINYVLAMNTPLICSEWNRELGKHLLNFFWFLGFILLNWECEWARSGDGGLYLLSRLCQFEVYSDFFE